MKKANRAGLVLAGLAGLALFGALFLPLSLQGRGEGGGVKSSPLPPRPLPQRERGGQAEEKGAKPIDAAVRHAVKTWNVPGAAVVVVRDDRILYLQGHGVREAGKNAPVTPDTVFALSSCTKAFTSALIARLADEGALSWDDRVRDHLPWFRLSDPLADAEVRLRDLLCHRTGLGANELLWRHASWSPEEAVRRAGKVPLQHPFRTRLQYQSTMAAAGGLAAAAAGKGTWEGLVRRKLLEPLGMTATYLTTAEAEKSGQLAASHARDRTGAPAVTRTYRFAHADSACGAYSTARDLGRWLRFHLNEGAVNGKPVVSAKRLRETHTPHMVNHLTAEQWALWPDTTQFGYALGWVVYDHNGHRVVSHGGAIDGFRSHVLLVPEKKIGIAILVNLHQSFLPVPLANTLLDHLLGLPKRDWHAMHRAAKKRLEEEEANDRKAQLARRKLGTTPTRELAAYAGTYEHPAYGTAKVALRRGGLVWSWRDEEAALEHFHYNTFTAAAEVIGDAEITFSLDETGTVSELAITGGLNVSFRKAPAGRKSP